MEVKTKLMIAACPSHISPFIYSPPTILACHQAEQVNVSSWLALFVVLASLPNWLAQLDDENALYMAECLFLLFLLETCDCSLPRLLPLSPLTAGLATKSIDSLPLPRSLS